MTNGESSDQGQLPSVDGWPRFTYWVKVGAAVIAIVVALLGVLTLKTVFLLILASLVLAMGMQPPIDFFVRRGWKRGTALTAVLIGIAVPVLIAVGMLLPTAVDQVGDVADSIPEIQEELRSLGGFGGFVADRMDSLTRDPDGEEVTRAVQGVATSTFNLFTVLVLTPYFAGAFPQMKRWALRLLHREDRKGALDLLNTSSSKVSSYILGNLTISLIAGIVAGVGLGLIGVRSAIVLAIWIALTDLIPIAGAFLGAIPAVAIAALDGAGPAIAVALLLLGYQLVENYLIAPRVMKNAIDLSPAAVIIAIMIGSSLAGVLGALLALPLAAVVKLVIEQYIIAPRIDSVRESPKVRRNVIGRVRDLP